MKKAQLFWSSKCPLALDTNDSFLFDPDYLFDVPDEVVKEYEELKERNEKLQAVLFKIYKEKNP
jgi:flagellar assembly factor FliW